MRLRALQLRAALALGIFFLGCGARTTLDTNRHSSSNTNTTNDPCPFAVWSGSAKPLTGYCSTRDGRARGISAPMSPHVIWTTPIPYDDDESSIDRATTIVTDDASHAYVAPYITIGGTAPVFNKIDTQTGAILLSATEAETRHGTALFLPSSKTIEVINEDAIMSIASFQPTSSTSGTASPFGFTPIQVIDPAIGASGELYFIYAQASFSDLNAVSIFVTRTSQDGVPTWTSVDLSTLGAPPRSPAIDNVYPVGIALTDDGEIVATISLESDQTNSAGTYTLVVLLDPTDGHVRKHPIFPGQASPAVIASDGTIGIATSVGDHVVTSNFVLLDEAGVAMLTMPIVDVTRVVGVTVDNHFLVATNTGVSAIDESGNTLWTQNLEVDDFASIGNNGIAVIKGELQITGLNVTTGAILWTLVPPHAGQCISNGTLALTSDGTVIALQCDGTLFAAAD